MDVRGEIQDPVPGKKPLLPTEQKAGVGGHSLSECYRTERLLSSPGTIATQPRPDIYCIYNEEVEANY